MTLPLHDSRLVIKKVHVVPFLIHLFNHSMSYNNVVRVFIWILDLIKAIIYESNFFQFL